MRAVLTAVLVIGFVTALFHVLATAKFDSILATLLHSRLTVVAMTIRDSVQATADLGIALSEVRTADALMLRAHEADPDIESVEILDPSGTVLFSTALDPLTRPGRAPVLQPITSSFGEPLGSVSIHYRVEARERPGTGLREALLRASPPVALGGLVLLALALAGLRMRRARLLATAAVLVLTTAGLGMLTAGQFNRLLAPELERRATLIGEIVDGDLERALGYGIPLEGLYGVQEYFADVLADFPEVRYVVLADTAARPLSGVGAMTAGFAGADGANGAAARIPVSVIDYRFEVSDAGTVLAAVHVGIDRGFVQRQLNEIVQDVVVVLVVALLVTFELMLLLLGRSRDTGAAPPPTAAAPGAPAPTVADPRIALFTFAFAEELQKSFLPLYVRELYRPVPLLDESVVISLPIAVWLAALMLWLPVAGRLVSRLGDRRLFLMGLVPAAVGLAGCAFAGSVAELVLWRALSGIGYATVIVAGQAYVLRATAPGGESAAMGMFVAVLMNGTLCGTAIGGILADRIGFGPVFLLGAAITVLSAALAVARMARDPVRPGPGAPAAGVVPLRRAVATLLRNPAFALLMAAITIPAAVATASVIWYLVPLQLAALGEGTSSIGRVLLLYYGAIVVAAPLLGGLFDRHPRYTGVALALAGVVAGTAIALVAVYPSPATVAITVAVTGIAHAVVRALQVPFALRAVGEGTAAVRGAVLDVVRLLERAGMVAGLLVAAVLLGLLGSPGTFAAVGLSVAVAALVFAVRPAPTTQPVRVVP